MISHRHAAGAASRVAGSAEGAEYFLVCREPAGRLLRVGEPAVHRDLEDAAAGPAQSNLRGGLGLQDRVLRRTGARFIASHSAVFDLDLHVGGPPGLWTPLPGWQEMALPDSPGGRHERQTPPEAHGPVGLAPLRRRGDAAPRAACAARAGHRHRTGRRPVRSRHQLPHRRPRRAGGGARGIPHHPAGASEQPDRAVRPVRGRRCRRRRDQRDGPVGQPRRDRGVLPATACAGRHADRGRWRPYRPAADPARDRQGPAGRAGAVRRPSRHAGYADGHAHQPRHHLPPRGGGRPARPEAHGAGRAARQHVQRRRCGLGSRGRHARHHHGRVRSSSGARASSRRSVASSATVRPMSASTSMAWMRRTRWAPACRRSAATRCATRR